MAKALTTSGIAASLGTSPLPGIGKLLSFSDPKDTIIEVFAEAQPAGPVTQPGAAYQSITTTNFQPGPLGRR